MLGDRLRRFRKNAGLTQEQISDVLGIDRSTYAYYETNKTSPSIPYLVIISKLYCITVDELLGLTDKPLRLNDDDGPFSTPETDEAVPNELLRLSNLSDEEQTIVLKLRLMEDKTEVYRLFGIGEK